MKVEARLAMNSNNEAELEWDGRTGMEFAKWFLSEESKTSPVDSLDSRWAGGSGGPGLSNSLIAAISLPWTVPVGNGEITIQTMVDQERRANINTADSAMLEQSLVLMGVDAGDYSVIANSILDWIDPDNNTRLDGAEEDFYKASEPAYFPKNGPIDDLTELLLIKGIRENPDIFYGPGANTALPSRINKRTNPRLGFNADVPIYQVGMKDLFTPVSSGRINLNTADVTVLQLIPGMDERMANEVIRLRAGPDGTGMVPLNNPGELINAGIPPNVVQQISRYADVRSRTFEVTVDARIGDSKGKFRALLIRNNPRDIQVTGFRKVE
jgi:type II secretory pathway component PulK